MSSSDVFTRKRTWFETYLRTTVEEAAPIEAGNVGVVETLIMEAELDATLEALEEVGEPGWDPGEPWFARQWGTTCMSTSLANGLISLGEPSLAEDTAARVEALTRDVVEHTSAMGKPGEYRSVDDLYKYLESGRLGEVELGDGVRCAGGYRVRLTGSLLDVVEALWTGEGRLVLQRSAHAHLVFGLECGEGGWGVRRRDPMREEGPGYDVVGLEELRRDYLWSPLKKIPRLMGFGFERLEAEELLGHLERYEDMENLGLECPSALLSRRPVEQT